MKIYIWVGNGMYVSAQVTVVAESFEQAKGLIQDERIKIGLSDDIDAGRIRSYSVDEESVVFSDNGDY